DALRAGGLAAAVDSARLGARDADPVRAVPAVHVRLPDDHVPALAGTTRPAVDAVSAGGRRRVRRVCAGECRAARSGVAAEAGYRADAGRLSGGRVDAGGGVARVGGRAQGPCAFLPGGVVPG